jgi:hypothetical protein
MLLAAFRSGGEVLPSERQLHTQLDDAWRPGAADLTPGEIVRTGARRSKGRGAAAPGSYGLPLRMIESVEFFQVGIAGSGVTQPVHDLSRR